MDNNTFILFFIIQFLCFIIFTGTVKFAINKKAQNISINRQDNNSEADNDIEAKPEECDSSQDDDDLYNKADEMLDAICESREKPSH